MVRLPRGALLNFATVLAGALVGLAVGNRLPVGCQSIALSGIGLAVLGIGVKMFFRSTSGLIVVASIALGGILGVVIGIDSGLQAFSEMMRQRTGATDANQFNSTLVATSVLFCVGPMTILGCMQDALEDKLELIGLKSAMDGVAAVFFAATSVSAGLGVLVTAGIVLVCQSLLTFGARALQRVAKDEPLMAEITATGGVMLLGTALGLLDLKHLPVANYLPGLLLAPLFVILARKVSLRKQGSA